MMTQTIEGRARQYINYETRKRYEGSVNLDGITEHSEIHKTLHKCSKCGFSMMINKKTKKEWCEYCEH